MRLMLIEKKLNICQLFIICSLFFSLTGCSLNERGAKSSQEKSSIAKSVPQKGKIIKSGFSSEPVISEFGNTIAVYKDKKTGLYGLVDLESGDITKSDISTQIIPMKNRKNHFLFADMKYSTGIQLYGVINGEDGSIVEEPSFAIFSPELFDEGYYLVGEGTDPRHGKLSFVNANLDVLVEAQPMYIAEKNGIHAFHILSSEEVNLVETNKGQKTHHFTQMIDKNDAIIKFNIAENMYIIDVFPIDDQTLIGAFYYEEDFNIEGIAEVSYPIRFVNLLTGNLISNRVLNGAKYSWIPGTSLFWIHEYTTNPDATGNFAKYSLLDATSGSVEELGDMMFMPTTKSEKEKIGTLISKVFTDKSDVTWFTRSTDESNREWGIIDAKGRIIKEPFMKSERLEKIIIMNEILFNPFNFSSGVSWFQEKDSDLLGIIDSSGNIVKDPFSSSYMSSEFKDGVAYTEMDDKDILVNSKGKVTNIDTSNMKFNGMDTTQFSSNAIWITSHDENNPKTVILNTEGNLIYETEAYITTYYISNNITEKPKYMIFDEHGFSSYNEDDLWGIIKVY